MSETLNVIEIYRSIQGESTHSGFPCVMVRLSGCNLECEWCDTTYARQEGTDLEIDQILESVGEFRCRRVELTGGEPLLQPASIELLRRFCDEGFTTLLETNGSQDISPVDPRVAKIIDVKCPSSRMDRENRWENFKYLGDRDESKFVLADRGDFKYAQRVLRDYPQLHEHPVTFSPVMNQLRPSELAAWMLGANLPCAVRLGVQLHKIIWPDAARRV
ncbi:MAG: 7-carboxy-7-deazaguanine synthase QueE [Phycisphaerae bacterium]